MAEQLKMDLRPKRRPKYRASDQQDPDNPTYNRPNYLKMSTTPHTQDYTSPSIQLNLNAKLLVKFIQKANKFYNDIRPSKDELQRQANKKQFMSKDKNVREQFGNGKKQGQNGKNQKSQSQKKAKELYNFKEIHQNTELMKNLSQQQAMKGVKNFQNLSGLIDNKGIYSGPLSNQLSQLQSLYPNICETQIESKNQKSFQLKKQVMAKSTKSKPQQKEKQNVYRKQKLTKEGMQKSRVNNHQEQKVFKRSAYHVAIAYHIYLKMLSNQGITSGDLIDPTYKARMVKEQSGITF